MDNIIERLIDNDQTLIYLYLYYYSIGDKESKALANSLKHNSILNDLSIDDNHINDKGAKALVPIIKI